MRNDEWNAMREDSPPGRGNVWLQRCAGIVLGGLAGTAAAYSPDVWAVLWGGGISSPAERAQVAEQDKTDRSAPIPAPDANETAHQIVHTLIIRARDLIARGELREAERFLAAAEKLEPDSTMLAETFRLLYVAKAKIDLADKAPAAGTPSATKPPQTDVARAPERKSPDAVSVEIEFATGVREFHARNYNAALAALGKAAAAGHAPAQNYVGYMYRHGLGVQQDFAKAISWYQKAAAQNHGGALNNIGYMYRHGLGVDRDYAEAKAWFMRSAERGDVSGQYNLGQMFADGVGAAADYREAFKWYKTATDQGHGRAAMGLAHLYAQGLGVTADPSEAYFWYSVAARSGVEGAQRFRTALGAQLSERERQAADARLSIWKTQSADGETE